MYTLFNLIPCSIQLGSHQQRHGRKHQWHQCHQHLSKYTRSMLLTLENLFSSLLVHLSLNPTPRHEIPQSIKQERTTIATSLDVPLPPKEKQSNREPAAGSPQLPVFTNNWFQDFQSEAFGMKSQENSDGAMTPGLLDMNLSSPTSFSNWSFFPPLSPRIM
ncbi:hypothetical protein SESBI_43213 [Sesbania bispinosa]|nr:hypothetical protein SESBI_43213 [Sesbania bispinosa]